MADETLLVLDAPGVAVQPFSARGITQVLSPIDAAVQFRRDVNGELVDLSLPQFQKYRMELSCTDVLPGAFDSIWPGKVITVDGVQELSYLTAGGSPGRDVVPGTSRVLGAFTFYRPRFVMMVVGGPSQTFAEWPADAGWTLQLEEV